VARVVLEHLTKDFPVAGGGVLRAVNDLSLTVEESEWLVLLGPSGCGKTTTLRLVAGLEEPTSGEITIDGRPLNTVPARKRDVAIVFQNPALYPHLSAFENMAFGLRIRHVPRREIADRVRTAAELLGVADCLPRKPMELSGGQRQRVALGRALVRQPRLLLLDEPLANLDPTTQAELRTELLELRGCLATSALYVTHDQQEAMILGTRIGVLRHGTLQQTGTVRELYERPANMFVAGFLGSPPMSFLKGTLQQGPSGIVFNADSAAVGLLALKVTAQSRSQIESWIDRPVVLGLRPEAIQLAGATVALQAVVEAVEELGPDKHVHLKLGSEKITARVPASQTAGERDQVPLHLEMQGARLFDPATEKAVP
jgi:multiple sugar transport system ATP-binding protein